MSYQDFLLNNATRITSIESTLRSLTWFLPGRFKDAELASEALYATLNLLSLYHDGIISKAAGSLPSLRKPTLSSHGRYTSAWSSFSSTYNYLAHALAIISRSELLIEMIARRKLGSRRRWRVVLMLECFKALLRLKLVALTRRMLVNPPLPQRTIDPTTIEAHRPVSGPATHHPSHQGSSSAKTIDSSLSSDLPSTFTWVGKRTGTTRPTIASLRAQSHHPDEPHSRGSTRNLVNEYLSRRALTLEGLLKPLELIRKLRTNKARLAELIWILRPVIYALTINRFGQHHPAPFLFSLSIEYLSYSLRQSSLQQPLQLYNNPHGTAFNRFVSELERTEFSQRQKAFWCYFLRGPLWILWTKPKLISISQKLSSKPLLNLISLAIQDYTPLIDEYHYYTS
ncbi:hypothetical protein O181_033528 [Austropuccinia psidii MF-1]|uniref:Peroxisomal membrane protein PEX16 n=1 Tax=Austropuccinia psidii MF-1 TaxID=1389203 RepID=A0A9Q3D3R7_9BASI|nr:hypothetical protein [Austropuccinia psidii MF-1]